jgi:hypothetical protein
VPDIQIHLNDCVVSRTAVNNNPSSAVIDRNATNSATFNWVSVAIKSELLLDPDDVSPAVAGTEIPNSQFHDGFLHVRLSYRL